MQTTRETPRLGTVKDSTRWHFGEGYNFDIETLCGERFIPMQQGWVYNDWIYSDGDLNACSKCERAWEFRTTEINELNSMFNLPNERLAPAGPNVGFGEWLEEMDNQDFHLDSI